MCNLPPAQTLTAQRRCGVLSWAPQRPMTTSCSRTHWTAFEGAAFSVGPASPAVRWWRWLARASVRTAKLGCAHAHRARDMSKMMNSAAMALHSCRHSRPRESPTPPKPNACSWQRKTPKSSAHFAGSTDPPHHTSVGSFGPDLTAQQLFYPSNFEGLVSNHGDDAALYNAGAGCSSSQSTRVRNTVPEQRATVKMRGNGMTQAY